MVSGRLFHGWIVVGAVFAALFIGFGVAYCFAAFFLPLQQEYGARRGDISLVFSIAGFLYFALGAVSGPMADRFGPRRVVFGGMALVAIGLWYASRADALWQVYVGYGLGVGIGVGFAYVPAIAAVQRWFSRRRGLASGIAVSGIGAGTLIMPLLAGWLIELTDWRSAYVQLAILTMAMGGGAALLIEASPEKRGLSPDGERSSAAAGPAHGDAYVPARQAFASRPFWLMYGAAVLASFGIFMPFVHLVPYAIDRGVGEALALSLISAIGIGSTVGRFAFGGVADRLGRRRALALTFFGTSAMMLVWYGSGAAWALILFAVLFGMFYGGFVALIPALTADYFGSRQLGAIIGWLYTSVSVGTLVGPPLAGYSYDVFKSYDLPILAAAASQLSAALCLLLAPDPTHWRTAHARRQAK